MVSYISILSWGVWASDKTIKVRSSLLWKLHAKKNFFDLNLYCAYLIFFNTEPTYCLYPVGISLHPVRGSNNSKLGLTETLLKRHTKSALINRQGVYLLILEIFIRQLAISYLLFWSRGLLLETSNKISLFFRQCYWKLMIFKVLLKNLSLFQISNLLHLYLPQC